MDVCKCIVPSRHGGTLNSCRGSSPLVRLVEEEERLETSAPPSRMFSLKIGVEPSKIALSPAWCSKLRLTTETIQFIALLPTEAFTIDNALWDATENSNEI
ncbi:hypothetical protein TNCV_1370911 [Trichonephila clavipes]|nr:hypothetical protein TNCV_1370911 [Trichonephila clavipes]